MRQKLVLTQIFLLFMVIVNAQKLTRNEKKIVKNIERNNAEAISFLEKVVNINSGTLNLKGIEKVGQ